MISYPEGMSLIEVSAQLSAVERPRGGRYRVEFERKFGFAGTGWFSDRYSEWFRLVQGELRVKVPHSDQPGLIGDNGAALPRPLGVKIEIRPTSSEPIRTLAFNILPMSLGSAVTLDVLKPDLGGWPNSVIVTTPSTPVDPANPQTQLVETYPGSRIFGKA